MIESILFYIFALISVIAAGSVIISRNPVRAVLSLVVAFVSTACLWMLLEVEFLALALIVIYVGAVMVLFLFVVMMLNIGPAERRASFVPYWPAALILGILFIALLTIALGPQHFGLSQYPAPAHELANYSNIKALGMELYTDYIYPFEIAAVLLLAAMIAAIALTHRAKQVDTKTQKPSDQINTRASDRLQLIDLPRGDHS